MAQEIERKFLVKGEYKHMAQAQHHMVQGYICSTGGRTVRVRIADDKAYLTIKGPSANNGLTRYEWEHEIPVSEARELMGLCEPGMIEKTRYLIPFGNHVFEVDEFFGDNSGLVVAEVELRQENEPFERPPFLGQEVTGDRRYYNSSLMKCPYSEWKNK